MIAFRTLIQSIGAALAHPRVLFLAWSIVTVPAILVALPMWEAYDQALSHHPGTSFLLDQALDTDFDRLESPGLPVLAGALFVFLAFVFLAGGILATVGTKDRFVFSTCLAEGGRGFVRNLRVMLGLVVVCLLVFWGRDALDSQLRSVWLYDVDPAAVAVPLWLFDLRWGYLLELLDWFWGFVFIGLVFTSKVAMAQLIVHQRRSAFLAWTTAIARVLRRPLCSTILVGGFVTLWALGGHAFGWLTARFLEVERNLWLGLLFGQLGILWGLVIALGMFLAARRFLGPATSSSESPAES